MRSRLLLLFLAFCLAWTCLIIRSGQLQLLPDTRLAELQKRQYRTVIELPARRGNIIDRDGKELAVSIPTYSLFGDPKLIESPKLWAKKVSRVLGISESNIIKKLRPKSKRFVWIRRQLSKDQKSQLEDLKLTGMGFVEEAKRIYPNNALLSQVIGFSGREGQGLEGLEKKFDKELRGETQKMKVERDARGRPLLINGQMFAQSPSGTDLILTVDGELQFVLEKSLAEAVSTHNADSAMGVVLDASTSEILAMGYAPTYDLNRAKNMGSEFWRNRIVTDVVEPGSVLKPLLIAGAMREGLLRPGTTFNCGDGQMTIGKRTIREADQHHKFGNLTVSEILAKSSNVGTAKIALQMGADKIEKTYRDFGIGSKLSEQFFGEAKGIIQARPWSKHLMATMSFGHGIAVSPLQIAAAYAAIASDGILRRPFIVKEMRQWETGERIATEPEEIRRVLSKSEAETMRLMLHQATEVGGTGIAAQVPGFPVAGKTGTAQKVSETGGYSKGEYISSFAGMIPAQKPKYVIYVTVNNPREKYYGSEVAAPLFSRVAGYAIRKSGLAPVKISQKNLVKIPKANKQALVQRLGSQAKIMNDAEFNRTPDLKGLSLREVYQQLKGTPLKVRVRGRGRVSHVYPEPGSRLPDDKTIKVQLE